MTIPAVIYITYLGTACFLFDFGGYKVLTDPGDFFTNRFTIEQASNLKGVDLVLVSHADFDHTNRLEYIPGIEKIPIFGTESVKKGYPHLNVNTDAAVRGARDRHQADKVDSRCPPRRRSLELPHHKGRSFDPLPWGCI
jgi:L-ascorbate metabolism protein UlaG (beta-lactamase superfamily)